MSTYLLAWVVSKYESATNMSARGVKFEAFYSDASLVQRAADVGAKMLDHFEQKVFGIKYKLPKIDIVAVEKFSGAAMENWGMMTFNNKFVLHSPDWKSSDIYYCIILHRKKYPRMIQKTFKNGTYKYQLSRYHSRTNKL